MSSLGMRLHRNYNVMGDSTKTASCVPSTSMHNVILCILILHIVPNCHIYVAIDNPLLVPSVSCVNSCSYHSNFVRVADDVPPLITCTASAGCGFLD
jgi:hypothetical protein